MSVNWQHPMIFIFNTLMGIVTFLVFILYLKDYQLYFGLVLAIILSVGNAAAAYQIERSNRMENIIIPIILDLMKDFGADNFRVISSIAANLELNLKLKEYLKLKELIIDILIASLISEDETEKYWIYITLGKIGSKSKKAESAIKKGTVYETGFAKLGADEAWRLINQ